MDKKAKKRIEVLRKKIPSLQQKLVWAKEQPDDPDEPARLQKQIDDAKAEIEKLRSS